MTHIAKLTQVSCLSRKSAWHVSNVDSYPSFAYWKPCAVKCCIDCLITYGELHHIYICIYIYTLGISEALAKCIQIYPNVSNTDLPRSQPGTVVDGQALGALASCHDVEQSKTSKPRRPHLRHTWRARTARIYMDLHHSAAKAQTERHNIIWHDLTIFGKKTSAYSTVSKSVTEIWRINMFSEELSCIAR